MTKAPERIWAEFGYDMRRGAFWDKPSNQSIEYVHVDHALAMVASSQLALEEAWKLGYEHQHLECKEVNECARTECARLSQTPYKATDKLLREARNEALRGAAKVLIDAFSEGASHVPQHKFWMAYWENCGSDEQDVYGGVIAALRALAEGDNQ